ncbi:MAG: family 16 glycosylhydrolase [Firmicutes bacterium]|nr:family 16 glycosylhydrolase [Bacillota bacterium]
MQKCKRSAKLMVLFLAFALVLGTVPPISLHAEAATDDGYEYFYQIPSDEGYDHPTYAAEPEEGGEYYVYEYYAYQPAAGNQANPANQGQNLLANGDFSRLVTESGNGWSWQGFAGGVVGAAALITEGPDAGSQRLNIINVGNQEWEIQLSQDIILHAGVEYELRITARSSQPRPVVVEMINRAPWWLRPTINLTEEWQTFTPAIPVLQTTESGTVRFLFGGRTGFIGEQVHDIFIREVSLVAVGGEIDPGPGPQPWDGIFGEVRTIRTPVAGHFNTSLYRFPFRNNGAGNAHNNGFDQTLIWYPHVDYTFLPDTEYTVTIVLEPNNRWGNNFGATFARSFEAHNITHLNFDGLPTEGVRNITSEFGDNGSLRITVEYEATGSVIQDAELILFDDFTGGPGIGNISTYFSRAPQWWRQDMSAWRNEMSNIETRGDDTLLVLSFERDTELAPANRTQHQRDNFIRAGGVRTQSATGGNIHFENAFGYYEARIKFPAVNNMWGAFWLMTPNWVVGANPQESARRGTEIDIIESFHYPFNSEVYAALHFRRTSNQNYSWYGAQNKFDLGFNVFDGEFHIFSLEWNPNEYIYFVNGVEFARYNRDSAHRVIQTGETGIVGVGDISQNPNYLKLSVEAACWAGIGSWSRDEDGNPNSPGLAVFDPVLREWIATHGGEMLVDYVAVWNGPRPNVDLFEPVPNRTVTFTVGNGAVGVYAPVTTTVEVPHGRPIPAEAIPTAEARRGFYFAGWYPHDPAVHGNVQEDLAFTARFNILFHYATFAAGNGGVEIPLTPWSNPVRVRDGWVIPANSVPYPEALPGYSFIGWTVAGVDGTVDPVGFDLRENTTFTAVFRGENPFAHLEFGVRPIAAPVAGHFPTSLYRWAMRPGGTDPAIVEHSFGYYLTLEWYPTITRYFLPDTSYTVTIIMEPATAVWVPDWHDRFPTPNMWAAVFGDDVPASFYVIGATLDQVVGLPTEGVVDSNAWFVGDNFHVSVTFAPTGPELEEARLLLFENFSGPENEFGLTGYFDRAPNNLFRQNMSIWTDEMSFIRNNQMVLAYELAPPEMFFEHMPGWWNYWPPLTPAQMTRASNNFVRAGAVRTLTSCWLEATFEHAFGYYEARIRFPVEYQHNKQGTWGAFWLMNRNLTFEAARPGSTGRSGTEIDVFESINNHQNQRFNAAIHWGGYVEGGSVQSVSQAVTSVAPGPLAGNWQNIYDGNYHTFSVEWSPTNYRFFVNGYEFASLCRMRQMTGAAGNRARAHQVTENPSYIKLSVETALWALNAVGSNFNFPRDLYGEMIIDYVAVWNGPRPNVNLLETGPELSFDIFNNGPGGSPSRPNEGLAAAGIIRMWTQLDGVNAPVYLAAADTIVATDQDGNCAEEFIRVGRVWQAGTGWLDYFNLLDVNKDGGSWQYINLYITAYGQTVHVLLVNALYQPAPLHEFRVRPIPSPVAGHFPASLYRWALTQGNARAIGGTPLPGHNYGYDHTLVWYPPIERYFLPDTVYTLEWILEPNPEWHGVYWTPLELGLPIDIEDMRWWQNIPASMPPSFAANNITHEDIVGLPTERVTNITSEHRGDNLHIFITFEATGPEIEVAGVIFHDDFSNPIDTDPNRPGMITAHREYSDGTPASGFARATPYLWRQDMSYWDPAMAWIDEERDLLVLGIEISPDGFETRAPEWQQNAGWWNANQHARARRNTMRAGGVRTMSQDWEAVYWENAFGFYEARISFPDPTAVHGAWGAFWLMSRYFAYTGTYSVRGQEIDIVESINGHNNCRFNWALWWSSTASAARGYNHPGTSRWRDSRHIADVSIYDGAFHTFAVEWSPDDYIFFVNGIEVGRLSELPPQVGLAVNRNPNYMKLSMESALWALPGGGGPNAVLNSPLFYSGETHHMYVDYVTVWNGPRPLPDTDRTQLYYLAENYGDLTAEDVDDFAAYTRALANLRVIVDSPLVEQWLIDRIVEEFLATLRTTPVVESVVLEYDGARTTYFVGDALDVTGLYVVVTYSDGTYRRVPVTTDMVTGFYNREANPELVLTITYDVHTLYFTVAVIQHPILPQATESRPFPQAGLDTGRVVELFRPTGFTQEQMNEDVLRAFATIVEGRPWAGAITGHPAEEFLTTVHGQFIVDPATLHTPEIFRMLMFLDHGTGGSASTATSRRVTVSESMGYGMMMLVQMAGSEDIPFEFNGRTTTIRQIMFDSLPVQLQEHFGIERVNARLFFDGMFRSVRHWPTHPQHIVYGHRSTAANANINNNAYRGNIPANFRASYLMAWSIHYDANIGGFRRESGPSNATDGCMDIAYALILAAEQWGDVPVWCPVTPYTAVYGYAEWANRMVNDIWLMNVHRTQSHVGPANAAPPNRDGGGNYHLTIGNWVGGNQQANVRLSRASDFIMQHLKAYKAVNPENDWQRVIDVTYGALEFITTYVGLETPTGVVNDFIRWDNVNNTWIIPVQGGRYTPGQQFHESTSDGARHWNACRVPWRLGVDIMFSGTTPVEHLTTYAYNTFVYNETDGRFRIFGDIPGGGTNVLVDGVIGRWLDGTPNLSHPWGANSWNAFWGPMTVLASIYGPQRWMDEGWSHVNQFAFMNNQYGDYINLFSMIAASGNEWTPVGNPLVVYGGTIIYDLTEGRKFVYGARVPLRANIPQGMRFSYWELEGADFWPGFDRYDSNAFIAMPNNSVVARAVFEDIMPVLTLDIFNNGPGGSPSRPNASLAAAGLIRMWIQLDGVNTLVPYQDLTVTAAFPTGDYAMDLVRVNQPWTNQGYVNFIDVNTRTPWQRIYLTVTLNGQAVEVTLVNPE